MPGTQSSQDTQRLSGNAGPSSGETRHYAALQAPERCTHHLFEAQVDLAPDAVAVVCAESDGQTAPHDPMTYHELNRRANQLAHHLRSLGVGPETLVGICVERSPDLVVAVLGVWKAGAAFLPLDPDYPHERLALMFGDAGAGVLLTQQCFAAHPLRQSAARRSATVLYLDADWPMIAQSPAHNPTTTSLANNLAYVIYTSGSTGAPKGVMIEHAGLVNLAAVLLSTFDIRPDCRVLQFASMGFDAAVSEILMALLGGATLVLLPHSGMRLGSELLKVLRDQAITTITLVPSLLAVLSPENLPALRTVASAGEACPTDVAARWMPGRRFLNGYGPTEVTVAASYYHVGHIPDQAAGIAIGQPIANTRMYILDADLRPVPDGTPGELYVAGIGLARGYLNHPGLTAEKFIPNPFANHGMVSEPAPGDIAASRLPSVVYDRLYRTGDLARRDSSGLVEFLGRIDHQVKIRGFRIELDEIALVLKQHPAIQAAVVVMREDIPGDRKLVAYVVPADRQAQADDDQPAPQADPRRAQGPARPTGDAPAAPGNGGAGAGLAHASGHAGLVQDLRQFLADRLPKPMVPPTFVWLERLPLTLNGKIDRRALPAPGQASFEATIAAAEPRTPPEELVAAIWEEVLGHKQIGIHDDFFELGGDSLLAIRAISRIEQMFKVNLPVRALFDAPTISDLTAQIERMRRAIPATATLPIRPATRDDRLPLSIEQQRLWLIDQLEPGNVAYNLPLMHRICGPLATAALERSLQEIVRRHAILRTNIVVVNEQPLQVIAPDLLVAIPLIEPSGASRAAREAEAIRLAHAMIQRPFDLASEPLLRAALFEIDRNERLLCLCIHHSIFDHWSAGILSAELGTLYAAFVNGEPSPLIDLPVQYGDFAIWQRTLQSSEGMRAHLSYWKQYLEGAPALLELPVARPRPQTPSVRGASHAHMLPPDLGQALRMLSRREGASLFMSLLAAFHVLLHHYTGRTDLVTGFPASNRGRAEIEPLIGFFVNTLVIRTQLVGDPTFLDVIAQVRDNTLRVYEHQDVPFDKLVEMLRLPRDTRYHPIFQIMFVVNRPAPKLALPPGLEATALQLPSQTAAFDLSFEIEAAGSNLSCTLEYKVDLFDSSTIIDMLRDFQRLLEQIVTDPSQPLSTLLKVLPARFPPPTGATPPNYTHQVALKERDAMTAKDQRESQRAQRRVRLDAKRAGLSDEQRRVLETRLRGASPEDASREEQIPRRPHPDTAPLSLDQQRLWFLHQLEPESPAYNIPMIVRLKGSLAQNILEQSLQEVIERHEVLRTTFGSRDRQPIQIIAHNLPLSLSVVDVQASRDQELDATIRGLAAHEIARPFDLSKGPLVRATLWKLGPLDHVLLFVVHHIVFDAWSRTIFIREVASLYETYGRGQAPALAPLAIQYADFAHWQRAWLQGARLEQHLAYWRRQLAHAPPARPAHRCPPPAPPVLPRRRRSLPPARPACQPARRPLPAGRRHPLYGPAQRLRHPARALLRPDRPPHRRADRQPHPRRPRTADRLLCQYARLAHPAARRAQLPHPPGARPPGRARRLRPPGRALRHAGRDPPAAARPQLPPARAGAAGRPEHAQRHPWPCRASSSRRCRSPRPPPSST
ncbi:MAG: amino acid adenylation domain-containing protein [Kouleothrix sp.]|nr:amino acid adenylation domain-containing protein [Kouleothrix sp.]